MICPESTPVYLFIYFFEELLPLWILAFVLQFCVAVTASPQFDCSLDAILSVIKLMVINSSH